MLEREYQAALIHKIRDRFPGCLIIKTDPSYKQGIPDLLILLNDMWAALEVKRSRRSPTRPNQEHYVELMDSMSFARIIYPDNEEEVLNELEQSYRHR